MIFLAFGVAAYVVLLWGTLKSFRWKVAAAVMGIVLIFFMKGPEGFVLDPKVWGVVLMGIAALIFVLLPWLDQSPVKSIRYKGPLVKSALAVFVIAFLVLGYFGTHRSPRGTIVAQVFTLVYFAFFLLMPWYTRMEKTKPEPDRVTGGEHTDEGREHVPAGVAGSAGAGLSGRRRGVRLDRAPIKENDLISLQNGAHLRQLLPGLPRRELHALQPAGGPGPDRAADQDLPDFLRRQGRRPDEDGDGLEGLQGMVRRSAARSSVITVSRVAGR